MTRSEESGLVPLPIREFEPETDDQQELLETANQALGQGSIDTAIMALLSLGRTSARSEALATGMLTLSQLYHARGDLPRSTEVLEDLIAWAPLSASLEFIHATSLLDANQPNEAIEALRRAIRIDADYLRSYPLLVATLESIGQSQEAEWVLLNMERQALRLGQELDSPAAVDRKLQILRTLRIGYPQAHIAMAASQALDDDAPEVVEAALDTLEQVGTLVVIDRLQVLAQSRSPHAERAAELARTLGARR